MFRKTITNYKIITKKSSTKIHSITKNLCLHQQNPINLTTKKCLKIFNNLFRMSFLIVKFNKLFIHHMATDGSWRCFYGFKAGLCARKNLLVYSEREFLNKSKLFLQRKKNCWHFISLFIDTHARLSTVFTPFWFLNSWAE